MADGSISAPFTDLQTALENPLLEAGHTIYLRAGTHILRGDTTVTAQGVTVRPYPNESVVIDVQQSDLSLSASGLLVHDVTILSSDTQRSTDDPSYANPGIGAVDLRAPITLTNVRIAGVANLGWWTGSMGIWKGVLVQDSGWDATDRGHGHALYVQNQSSDGTKTLTACILINGWGYSLHAYGSDAAYLESVSIDCCIVMNELALIGGGDGASIDGVIIDDCVFYAPLQIGYVTAAHRTASLTNCLLHRLGVRHAWGSLTVSGCTLLAGNSSCIAMPPTVDYTGLHVDNNVYISSADYPFVMEGADAVTFAQWQAATGLDANSRHYATVQDAVTAGDLTVPIVRVFPVNEGGHVANIAIWNPLEDETVSVDLSALGMANGAYELRQVRDYTGDVRSVTYTGAAVDVPMSGTTAWPPGYPTPYHPEAVPANALPVFGAFELWMA